MSIHEERRELLEVEQLVYNHNQDVIDPRHRLLRSMEVDAESPFAHLQTLYHEATAKMGLVVCNEAVALIDGAPLPYNMWYIPNRLSAREAVLGVLQSERILRLNELERRFGELTDAPRQRGYRSPLERLYQGGPVERLAQARNQHRAPTVEKFASADWPVIDSMLRKTTTATMVDKKIFAAVLVPQTAGERLAMQMALNNYTPDSNFL